MNGFVGEGGGGLSSAVTSEYGPCVNELGQRLLNKWKERKAERAASVEAGACSRTAQ